MQKYVSCCRANKCVCVFVFAVAFDDCKGNKDVEFDVSHPDFLIDEDLNLVPRRDVMDSGTVIVIHWLSDHADDTAQVDVIGAPSQSTYTLRVSVCACVCTVCQAVFCVTLHCCWQKISDEACRVSINV